nr:hypothetical protein [Candidatus Microthrix sp.]
MTGPAWRHPRKIISSCSFSPPDPDIDYFRIGGDGSGEINHCGRWDFRHEQLTSDKSVEAVDNKPHRLIERDPKARHAFVCDGQTTGFRQADGTGG